MFSSVERKSKKLALMFAAVFVILAGAAHPTLRRPL